MGCAERTVIPRSGWWSIDVELDLLQVFLWAFPLPVVVIEATIPATQLLDIVVMGPPVHLVTRWGCEGSESEEVRAVSVRR